MARQKGSANVAASLEILAEAPLDARTVVVNKSDLTAQGSFPYAYVGMIVSVKSEGKLYMLTAMDTTSSSNWKEIGAGGGGGGSIDVDDAMSLTSENPVQNKVITQALNDKQATILSSIMTIGGSPKATVEDALNGLNDEKQDNLTFDSTPNASSTNPVTSGGIYNALAGKQNVLLASVMTIGGTTVDTIEGAIHELNDEKVNKTEVGTANGVAELDALGKVPASQLPSFVDDVIEGYYKTDSDEFYEDDQYTTLIPAESGKIYVDLTTNATYRWGGSVYVRVPDGVTLGETSTTAYRGDRGKVAYDFSQTPYDLTPAMNGTASAGNSDAWARGDHIHPSDTTKQDIMQFVTLPSPTEAIVGKIYQYIGATSAEYTNGYFYECKETSTGVYEWQPKAVQPGGGGSGTLGQAITASVDVGGIDKGTVFPYGTNYDEMWLNLIDPSVKPTIINPSVTVPEIDFENFHPIAEAIPSQTVHVVYDPGAIMLGDTKQADRAGAATEYRIEIEYFEFGKSMSTTVFDQINATGTFTIPTLAGKGNYWWFVTVYTEPGVQPKDSRGNDYGKPYTSTSITIDPKLRFINPYYYGVSDAATISSVSGLTQDVTAKENKEYAFTTNNQYMVIAYTSGHGNLTSIRDTNGFETISGWNKSTITVNGQSYYAYVSKTPTTDTNAKFIFEY